MPEGSRKGKTDGVLNRRGVEKMQRSKLQCKDAVMQR